MFITTLIARPGALDPALVESLRNAWGGGDAQWLSPDEAAEFAMKEIPGNRWDLWEDLQGMGVDLVVQRADGRRKKLLIADMDSTMIEQECIDELADAAGIGAEVKAITARAMNGEIGFEGALLERMALLRDQPEGIIAEVLAARITHMPGAAALVATMRAAGAHTALVSGGFTAFTERVADALGFDEHRANVLEIADGRLTGTVAQPILGRDAKVSALEEIAARLGIAPADAIAVGDGANDLGMLARAGMGVALHAKPSVAAQCDLRVNHGDLTALLYLQGYARDEFVGG
ncbi:phosphoserine phosphatase SerB [Roseovarius spongiae]|uniref:Phosphoserine phosphatase n=1 Tax=Roseovarius spongiae TaxID=2320272 RepID=A0A3A8B8Q0_9RHOB|nr:phosphoserine phosphatase SerB [Roseovarius spongiae]RKF14048.1 phosphoserine phosphatase SerB [Roseovarius spongiae]